MQEELKYETHLGDCREILPKLPENSVDAVVCDPQYGLSEHTTADIVECLKSWLTGAEFEKGGGGFMNKKWDAWVPGPDIWSAIHRVLKPGGYLLAFAGTRTSDLMGIAIRLAGFEIRDSIDWVYGSGFPKSSRVNQSPKFCQCGEAERNGESTSREQRRAGRNDKAVLSAGGDLLVADGVRSRRIGSDSQDGYRQDRGSDGERPPHNGVTVPASSPLQQRAPEHSHSGEHEDDQASESTDSLFRAQCTNHLASKDSTRRTSKHDVQKDTSCDHRSRADMSCTGDHSSGIEEDFSCDDYGTVFPRCQVCGKPVADGWGTALKPAHEPIVVARKPLDGTVAQNAMKHGTGGLNIDGCRVGTTKDIPASPRRAKQGAAYGDLSKDPATGSGWDKNVGRWPPNILLAHHPDCKSIGTRKVKGYTINRWEDGAKPFGGGAGHPFESEQTPDGEVEVWECVEGCPIKELDRQSGEGVSANQPRTRKEDQAAGMFGLGKATESNQFGDSGGASRFFPCFKYEPKASRSEREAGCEHLPKKSPGECTDRQDGSAGLTPRAGAGRSGGARNYHPTVKPVNLCRWLVRLVCPRGGVVLDPFGGSFTTAIAAYEEGCSCIVIEKEPDYFEIGKARLAYARRQRRLF